MLQPPEQFSQLKAAQWSAPLLTGAQVVMSLKSHGLASGNALMWVTGAAMVVSLVLAMQAVWGSTWGSRHQLVTVAALFLLVVMPLSTMMLPLLPQAVALPNGWLSAYVLLVLLGMLLIGVVIAMAMSAWLCLWPLGRTLGQAWRLRALEAQHGMRVESSHIQWLQKERQRFVVGRWWHRK
jgi:hypothetical protein